MNSVFDASLDLIAHLSRQREFARDHLKTALDQLEKGNTLSGKILIQETLDYIGETK